MSISVSGSLTPTIYENAPSADWSSRFRFPTTVLQVEMIGPHGALFRPAYTPSTGRLTLLPAQRLDAEELGDGASLSFGFRVRTSAGWQDLSPRYTVTLLGVDDTPPENLRFVSGGAVLANDIGAVIGDLIAQDPDTQAALEYSVAWPSSAWFEMSGNTLRLRDGVDLLALAGTTIAVLIEVSDGRNLAAGTVEVTVLVPGPLPAGVIQDGSPFADTLLGTASDDSLFGHAGPDLLIGEAGDDVLEGGAGNDRLSGGQGQDRLRGDEGADSLDGGAGADHLDGGEGEDTLLGAGDADTLLGANGHDLLLGGTEHDRLEGGSGNDSLQGEAGNDLLLGGAGEDSLTGGEGNDTLEGGEGADTLDGGAGVDRLAGGLGNDIYLLAAPDTDWVELPGEGIDTLVLAWSATISGAIEQLRLRAVPGDHSLTGSAGAEGLFGNAGRNLLRGLAGDDSLEGGAGDDTLDGGVGNDALSGDDGNDLLLGEAGLDSLAGGAGADTLRGGDGQDELLGDAGDDRLEGEAGADLLAGGAGHDLLLGGDGEDRVFGGDGADTLDGGAGQDSLSGGGEADLLRGAAGDDLLDGGEGADTLEGGEGADQLQGGPADDVLRAGAGGATGTDVLRGGAGADTLDATAPDRRASLLLGGEGNDLYLIDSPQDQILEAGSGGVDTVLALLAGGGLALPPWLEALVLQGSTIFGLGNAQDNRITGNALANLLFGGAGADTLEGGSGDDTLIGGSGRDIFILGTDGSTDVLVDFNPAEDRIIAPGGASVTELAGLPVIVLPLEAAEVIFADILEQERLVRADVVL